MVRKLFVRVELVNINYLGISDRWFSFPKKSQLLRNSTEIISLGENLFSEKGTNPGCIVVQKLAVFKLVTPTDVIYGPQKSRIMGRRDKRGGHGYIFG